MRTLWIPVAVLLVVSGLIAQPAIEGLNTTDTKLLIQPAISATHIAFIYAGDLYSADLNGGSVRRLSSDDGIEMNPVFCLRITQPPNNRPTAACSSSLKPPGQ